MIKKITEVNHHNGVIAVRHYVAGKSRKTICEKPLHMINRSFGYEYTCEECAKWKRNQEKKNGVK